MKLVRVTVTIEPYNHYNGKFSDIIVEAFDCGRKYISTHHFRRDGLESDFDFMLRNCGERIKKLVNDENKKERHLEECGHSGCQADTCHEGHEP